MAVIDWRTVDVETEEFARWVGERYIASHAEGMEITAEGIANAINEISDWIKNIAIDSALLDVIFVEVGDEAVGFRHHENPSELRMGLLKDLHKNPYVPGRDD